MSLTLVRLLQLVSPTLPVGAYTYSQGLEWAVESGAVKDEASALTWIGDLLEWNIGRYEAVFLLRMIRAWHEYDVETLASLDADFVASRETAELSAETLQMGYSLRRLLDELGDFPAMMCQRLHGFAQPSLALVWSGAASAWRIPAETALASYLWALAENQTMASLKTVPLGQAAGQRILVALGSKIHAVCTRAHAMANALAICTEAHALTDAPAAYAKADALIDDEFSNFSPGFAIACCRHETQYSRLFRS